MRDGRLSARKLSPRALLRSLSTFCVRHKRAAAGIGVGLLLVSTVATYVGVEATSTVGFCTSCHEMQPAYQSYLLSSHYNTEDETRRAACRDCHVPPWTRPIGVLWTKTYHGVRDVAAHFLDRQDLMAPGYQEEMGMQAPHGIPDAACLKCHDDVYTAVFEGRVNIHPLVEPAGTRCAECHRSLVHYAE